MYRIVHGSTHNLHDANRFIEILNTLAQHPQQEVRELFTADSNLFITRAPGRLDVIGGIADYSGSLVLQMPIAEATLVALQHDSERKIRIVSLAHPTEAQDTARVFEMLLDDFAEGTEGQPISYEAARALFLKSADNHWAAYIAGAFLVLMRERRISFDRGSRLLVQSNVPEGKGVSSSAALEVAAMQAIVRAYDLEIAPREIALLCQKVENLVVGAPCGVMDQMTSACGEENQLLALLCQPAELLGQVQIPESLAVWGLDSGVRHSVGGADYGAVRAAAFMGYRILTEAATVKASEDGRAGNIHVGDARWKGYLANLSPSEFEQHYRAHLPERITGGEFLSRYQGIDDRVSKIERDKSYAVRVATAHPVYENFRVRTFAELLRCGSANEQSRELLGELMFQSHASYSACGLGSKETDLLVNLVRSRGAAEGLYGAKITGGGSGGTVVILGLNNANAAVESVASEYEKETGHRPYIFTGSSISSAAFDHLRLIQA